MIWGYTYDNLEFLIPWALLTLLCLYLYRSKGGKLLLILPAGLAAAVAVLKVWLHTRDVQDGVGPFFLLTLALLHLVIGMVLDARATSFASKGSGLIGLVLHGFAYFTDNPFVFALFWVLSLLPMLTAFRGGHAHARLVFFGHHLVALAALLGALAVIQRVAPGFSDMRAVGTLPHVAETRWAAFLLVFACLVRQAMFPFHLWFKAAYKTRPFPLSIGFYVGNLGFILFIKLALPLLTLEARDLFPYAMACGVLSALYFANMALVQTRLRSVVFNVMLAQYATLYCGLETMTEFGRTGALFQFLTVGCCFTGLLSCLYLIEWEVGEVRTGRFHGLQAANPQLSLVFLLFSLAGMALPATMGFAGEDMIFHAVIERHPVVGIGLIVAAAINGIALFRVVCFLFRGTRDDVLDPTIDLSWWQKAALGVILAAMFLFGLFPSWLLQQVHTYV
jgi:NADH-quinone oxidoreductase subunit M